MSDDVDGAPISAEERRATAVALFNLVWRLLEVPDRSPEQDDRLLHAAHASRFHWGEVGESINLVRGEWQCSRVYSVLGRGEPALHHARRSLEICREHGIGDFDLAFAYEAMARAYLLAGDEDESARYVALANDAGTRIAEDDNRAVLLGGLADLPGG